MFSIEELFSKRNQRDAFLHFSTKKDGVGPDQMRLSELENYWKLNEQRIIQDVKNGTYQPGIIQNHEILNRRGKRRIVSSLCVIDRFLTRLLSQKLKRYLEPEFMENSFAYQEGKGILDAVQTAQQFIESGNIWVAEIDLQNYFDTVNLERLLGMIQEKIADEAVRQLIRSYLYCKIQQDIQIFDKTEGLVQGNSISPVLSNLYLHEFDCYLQKKLYQWIRFADNICIYSDNMECAEQIFEHVCQVLEDTFGVVVNRKKSGVFDVYSRRLLGYEFYKVNGKVACRKYQYQKANYYNNWKPCVIEKVNREYHLVQNGVLNKKDYSFLFEK